MDPADRRRLIARAETLLAGASIASADVVLGPEAVALGLTMIEDEDHGPSIINGNAIEAWFEVDAEIQTDPAFDTGVRLPVEFTMVTDADPPETLQRTMTITVIHQ